MAAVVGPVTAPQIGGGHLLQRGPGLHKTARIYSSDPFLWHVPRSARSGPGSGKPSHSAMSVFSPTPSRLDSAELIENRGCFWLRGDRSAAPKR